MSPPWVHTPNNSQNAVASGAVLDWHEARYVMLTDNSSLSPDDPAACMEMSVPPEQAMQVQHCIKALYYGLQLASALEISGGYAKQRHYGNIFLIDDPHIIGVFDNRNRTADAPDDGTANPKTLEELMELYRQGHGHIKTLVVFEKENHRLANSDERDRQANFIMDAVYPALFGITEGLSRLKASKQSWHGGVLTSVRETGIENVNQTGLASSQFISTLFSNPSWANTVLLENSPLQLFCNVDSPFNLDIDSGCIEAIQANKMMHQTVAAKLADAST